MGNYYTYEKDEYELLEEGDYEAVIENLERRTLATGKEKISIQLRIRQDVEQKYKNRVVYDDIWEDKENAGFFNKRKINRYLGTQNVQDKQEFDGINAIIDFLKGGNLVVHITKVFDDYRNKEINNVSYVKKSQVVVQTLGETQATTPATSGVVSGEDLPF